MVPILYSDDRSPPVRSILLLVEALNIDVQLKFVDLFTRQNLTEDFLKINPLHKVPVLQHDDLILTDSHAILIYLAETFGKDTSFAIRDTFERANILNRLMFNATLFFPRDATIMGGIFKARSRKIDEADVLKLREAYKILNLYLKDSEFVCGDRLTVADFSIVTTLSTIEGVIAIDKELEDVLRWFDKMKELPYYGKANQVGVDKLMTLVATFPE